LPGAIYTVYIPSLIIATATPVVISVVILLHPVLPSSDTAVRETHTPSKSTHGVQDTDSPLLQFSEMSGGRDPTQGGGLGVGRDMEAHGPDTILYYARAGNLEGVMGMVKADPTKVRE